MNTPNSQLSRTFFKLMIFGAALLLITNHSCTKDKWPEGGDPEQFTYLTGELAPFSYSDSGKLVGASVELLEAMFEGMELTIDRSVIELTDWNSAYQQTLENPGTVLFSAAKSAGQTELFKWVGPIATQTEIALYLPNTSVSILNVTDLNNYFTGVVGSYSSIDLLMKMGIYRANIIIYNSLDELYQALVVDREIQCISVPESDHLLMLKKPGYSSATFAAPYRIHSDELYYAFNPGIPDETVKAFQDQLSRLKSETGESGITRYKEILRRYNILP